ncbi:MAG TPA: SH3 domain-containing protein [Candidatus Wallbacteria bacterium]|nr:SH3 domain-containing protein [Candidatus Wallbacteria bacterium]
MLKNFRKLKYNYLVFALISTCFLISSPGFPAAADIKKPEKYKRVKIIPHADNYSKIGDLKTAVDGIKQAVKEKNAVMLLKYVDENIKIGFGAESGKAEFKKMWELDKNPQNSKLWKELETIFALGGGIEKDNASYTAPYTYTAEMDGLTDYQYQIVTGRDVNVREKPSSKSAVVKTIDREVVYVCDSSDEKEVFEEIGGESHPWKKVVLSGGEEGYIYGKFIRSALDYRLSIEKGSDGLYKITFMVSGD